MPAGSRASLIALVYDSPLIRFAGKESSKAMRWRVLWECAVAPGVPRRSLAAALVVGTLLNLINQGDARADLHRPLLRRDLWRRRVPARGDAPRAVPRARLTDRRARCLPRPSKK